jgi:putative ABC transport system permease protein
MLPYRGTRAFALGIDPVPFRAMTTVTLRGVDGAQGRDAALAQLADGRHCIVSENFARLHALGIGDSVEFPGRDGVRSLEIVALGRDYSWPRGTVFLDRHVFETELDDDLVDEFSVVVDDDADVDRVIADIGRAVSDDLDLVVTPADELRAGARQLLDDFFSLSYAQVAVAMAVAFLGVLNALWMAVILRRRELALLRAVGATRAQVVSSVLVQAACLGLLGGLLGVTAGVAVEWIVVQRVMPAETGWIYAPRYPWGAIALTFFGSLVASLIAGIVPARLAAATPLREALGDE